MNSDIKVNLDPEFKSLLEPLSKDERAQLEANLKEDGCRDDLIYWLEPSGERILLDGYNRKEICDANQIHYGYISKKFPDRAAAIKWIIDNQAGRRNLSKKAIAILRNGRKERVGEARANGQSIRTIANNEHVGKSTVERDLSSGVPRGTPESVNGTDGKSYPPTKPKVIAELKEIASPKALPDLEVMTKEQQEDVLHQVNTGKTVPQAIKLVQGKNANGKAREPGDDSAAEKEDKASRRRNGKPSFKDKIIEDDFAALTRDLTKRQDAWGKHKHLEACRTKLREAYEAWQKWQKETA